MSPRSYKLGKREVNVQETRRRILDAARELIAENGFHRASLIDVAKRADVTRATIYYQFDSKTGLLEAVVTDALERGGLERLIPLLQLPDARDALEASTRASIEMWANDYEIFHKLMGLAAVDPDVHLVVDSRDAERRSAMAFLVERLRREGYLSADCSDERALAVLILLTSFATFDSLYGTSRLSLEAVANLLIDLMQVVMR